MENDSVSIYKSLRATVINSGLLFPVERGKVVDPPTLQLIIQLIGYCYTEA